MIAWDIEQTGFEEENLVDSAIQACLRAVIEESGIDDLAGLSWEHEEHVRNPEDNSFIVDLLLDDAD